MKLVTLAVLAFGLAQSSAYAASAPLEIVLPGKTAHLTLAQLKAKLKPVTVEIDDPVYHARKTYDGFPLPEVLAAAGFKPGAMGDEIVFTAKDGYSPNTALKTLTEHEAFLVFREHGKSGFEKVAQGKAMLDPGPYYVVWKEGAKLGDSVPWPYQLVRIEVVDFKSKYPKLYPAGVAEDSDAMKGFLTFKTECLRCHSVNLEGGVVGPELNIPKSVTEYWAEDTLKSFIHDVSKFRARDKMPAFTHLSADQIDQLVAYLKAMKDRKVFPENGG